MSGYLIYHPPRVVSDFETTRVYYDNTNGNQDPYVWNQKFLHTYCHITQMSPQVGHINFWISGDTFPDFSSLYCDLVFVVAEKLYWENPNTIKASDPIVDTDEAYNDHYSWFEQHHYQRRRRFTLKADPESSFQPQNIYQELIDIVPFLVEEGFSLTQLRKNLRSGFNSKPMGLGLIATKLYSWLNQYANVKLSGAKLQKIRQENPYLTSARANSSCTKSSPRKSRSC